MAYSAAVKEPVFDVIDCVETVVDAVAEPPVLVAVKRKSYVVFANKPVIVAVVELAAGAVQVNHVRLAAVLYSNV